jgi:hypothetical protein
MKRFGSDVWLDTFGELIKKGVFTLFSFHSILHLAVSFFNLKPIL